MNLQELREKTTKLMDYNPEASVYRNSMFELINDAYMEIWTKRPWLFTHKTAELSLYPDITNQSTGIGIQAEEWTRYIEFGDSMDELNANGNGGWCDHWSGQPMEIEGREYEVLAIDTTQSLWLKEPFRGTDLDPDDESNSWSLKHRYYFLPADCLSLLSFYHADKPATGGSFQHAPSLPILQGEINRFPYDTTGAHAQVIIREPDMKIPEAYKTNLVWTSSEDFDSDNIANGTWVEVCWAFEWAGRYGALSEPQLDDAPSLQGVTHNTLEIQFQTHDGKAVVAPTRTTQEKVYPLHWEHLNKVVFFNANLDPATGDRLGPPCWVQMLNFAPDGDPSEYTPIRGDYLDSSVNVLYAGCFDPAGASTSGPKSYGLPGLQNLSVGSRYLENTIQVIRPWPRVTSTDIDYPLDRDEEAPPYRSSPWEPFKRAIIRYIKKPLPLSFKTDTPDMPSEFHLLIVYQAMQNICTRIGDMNMALFYEKRVNTELKSLERRYLNPEGQYQLMTHNFTGAAYRPAAQTVTFLG